jgi:hypothetical protein
MKKLTSFIILFSVVALTVSAQKKLYLQQHPRWIEWADTPLIHPVPPEHASQPAVMLINDIGIDYRVEGDYIVKHSSQHSLIKVLDTRGVNTYSTITIPLNLGTKVSLVKARTISPSGKIHVIDKKRILIGYGENNKYVIVIPTEGVEVNSEIEYLVKEINPCDYFGKMYFQYSIPVAKTRFTISYLKNMVVEGKSYNNFPVIKPEYINNRNRYLIEMDNIPALLPEENSYYNLRRMAYEYRVSNYLNENKEKIKLNTWNNFARRHFDLFYKLTKNERKAANNYLSELGVLANGDEATNIRKIEQGIKKHIALYDRVDYDERKEVMAYQSIRSMSINAAGYDNPKDVLDTIITKKSASEYGYIKLFSACLTQAGVAHEIGWAWDKTKFNFDPKFESWLGLGDHPVIYFPHQKKFLSPINRSIRYPIVTTPVIGSKGLFITIPTKGEVTGTLYKTRRITPLTAQETKHDISAVVSFNKNMDAKVDVSHEWYGYQSVNIRSELPFVRNENMKKYAAEVLDLTSNYNNIISYNFSNDDYSNYYTNTPLTLYASVNVPTLVNKAGNRYLIKAGKLIGNQDNLYPEKERLLPVDINYPKSYNYTITVDIPKGYKILNPEAIRMSADYLNGELDQVIGFASDYKLIKDTKNGDKLVITVSESYSQLHFSVFEFERYRNVLNTAADFSNLTLVLGKK